MMDAETWMNAKKALELGFCDEVLFQPEKADKAENSFAFSRKAVNNCLLDKLKACIPKEPPDPQPDPTPEAETVSNIEQTPEPTNRVNASDLERRLARFQYV